MYSIELKELAKKGFSEEHIHLLNSFILHQLAVYHSNLDPRLTPRQFMNFWLGQTLTYLANEPNPVPDPEEYEQLIKLVPPNKN